MSGECLMCGKTLVYSDDPQDELARDCGGDCWECMVRECPDDPDVVAYLAGKITA